MVMNETGFWFNPETYELSLNDTGKCRKIPTALFLLMAPCLGGLFVLFLPTLGFILVYQALRSKAVKALQGAERESNPTVARQRA